MKGRETTYKDGRLAPSGAVFLGIDASYTGFGLAILAENDSYALHVYRSVGSGVDRLVNIEDWLSAKISGLVNHRIVDAAIEGYSMGSRYGREMAGELGGVVRMVLRVHSLTINTKAQYPLVVSPQGLKKYVLGPGKGTGKSLMLKGVYKRWGVDLDDDNAADAYALARIARGDYVEKYQQEVLSKVWEPRI